MTESKAATTTSELRFSYNTTLYTVANMYNVYVYKHKTTQHEV